MPERRVIAHIDADAFYASVHLLEDPSLAGKPVIVAGTGPRSIVTTASYEARRFGIGSAMPASQARRLCPHGVFLRPDFELYRAYSRRAMAIVRDMVETVEPLSLDEAYLDITDLAHPVRGMRWLVAAIRAETGLTYSVGIGPNKLCAKMLSDLDKPAAFNIASAEQCCEIFAAREPRIIPGIGPKTADALAAMGFDTIAALRAAPDGVLEQAFGARRGAELRERASFIHHGRVEASRERKSISEERTFDTDIDDRSELETRLADMAADLAATMRTKDLRGRTIGIKVRLADWTNATRARTIDHHTGDRAEITAIALELLREYDPTDPVRLLGVRVSAFESGDADDHDDSAGREPAPGEQLRLPIRDVRRTSGDVREHT